MNVVAHRYVWSLWSGLVREEQGLQSDRGSDQAFGEKLLAEEADTF